MVELDKYKNNERYLEIKDNPFFLEELEVVSAIPDGWDYYNEIIKKINLNPENTQNSYIMYACGKVDKLDKESPCKFVEASATLPDIDVDFAPNVREKVIQYVKDKYGEDCVSQVITFSRLQGRSVIQEVMRSEGTHEYSTITDVTKNIPDEAEISDELALMENPSIIRWVLEEKPNAVRDYCYIDDDGNLCGDYKEVFRKALKLEGTYKSSGKHAAGVIISSEPIHHNAPMVMPAKGDKRICGLEMKAAEKAGLVKFDFLGLDTLEKVGAVLGNDLSNITLNDRAVWEKLQSGNTKGVFQLESHLGSTWSTKLKPVSVSDISDISAIIRPGTLQSKEDGKTMIQHYHDRKDGKSEVPKIHPDVDDILKETYGIILFQEQAMRVCQSLAGFTMAQADRLRKAIGKKIASLMAEVKLEFEEGCKKRGIDKEVYDRVFNMIESSSRYSFNKSHSISYAFPAYYAAYAKVHKPLEFYRKWLSSARNKNKDKQAEVYFLVNSAKIDGIKIVTPSAHYKETDFFIKDDSVIFGLSSIKGVGESELSKLFAIFDEISEKTEEIQWNQLIYRLDEINRRAVAPLINSGAFDFMGIPRARMVHEFNRFKEVNNKNEYKWMKENCLGKDLSIGLKVLAPTKKEGGGTSRQSRTEKIQSILESLENPGRKLIDTPSGISELEQSLMGVCLSASKLDDCEEALNADTTCKEISDGKSGKMTVSVELIEVKPYKIKKEGQNKGRTMAFVSAKDHTCQFDSFIAFPDVYEEMSDLLFEGNTVLILGEKDRNKDSVIIQRVYQI